MWFYNLVAILALGTVVIATYTDLKERIISNKLTFPMIVAGVALYLGYGAYEGDWLLAIKGGLGAGGAFGMGYVLWYVGGWAGGDVRLFSALGALLAGYSAPILEAPYPFPLTVLLNGIICLAPVLLIYVVVKSFRTSGVGEKIVGPIRESFYEILVAPFVILGSSIVGWELGAFLGLGRLVQVILIFVLILLIYQMPIKFEAPLAVALTGYGIYLYSFSALKFLGVAFAIAFGIRLIISSIKVVNRHVLQEKIPIDELEEGMIPAETIYEKDGEVERYESPGIKETASNILDDPTNFRFRPDWDEVVSDSSLAAGVSQEQAESLKRLVGEGELENHIRIKKGFPFAPSFALGVPIAIFYGDIYWWLVGFFGGGF
ncbi:hypothetical protein AKJ54_00450 [candidate division MSBL1 archaeon SCGC-AAA382K21]|uniref:Prepilin type IV endopeptidase peptidase domain-containing protein n=1 Tax=candidate division MSBL1 archaeon SCGC-AAA382K21 TaxID=1698283 RepID=A0A133VLJ9_9EURY|nr:hypothetical protein AKJ54_00450 [candidate division MSBL1 archaeon SCGC-AAA382K21]